MPVRGEGEGASAGGQSWGMGQPVEGVRPLGAQLFLAPLLALVYSAWLSRERPESGGVGMTPMPTPTLRPHCLVSSSSDSTAIRRNDSSTYPGGGVASKSRARRATHAQPGAHHDTGNPQG
jgi:hypothetical protein